MPNASGQRVSLMSYHTAYAINLTCDLYGLYRLSKGVNDMFTSELGNRGFTTVTFKLKLGG